VSSRLVGIDIGTSGLKVVLLDERGQTIDETNAWYDLDTPRPG